MSLLIEGKSKKIYTDGVPNEVILEFTDYVNYTTSIEYYERAEDITKDCSDIEDDYIDMFGLNNQRTD